MEDSCQDVSVEPVAIGTRRQTRQPVRPEDGEITLPRRESRGHSVTSAVGSAWEREPWIAVQRAAWEALRRRQRPFERAQP